MIDILSVFAQLTREQIKERTQMGLAEELKTECGTAAAA